MAAKRDDVSARVHCGPAGCDGVVAMLVPRVLERESAGYRSLLACGRQRSVPRLRDVAADREMLWRG